MARLCRVIHVYLSKTCTKTGT